MMIVIKWKWLFSGGLIVLIIFTIAFVLYRLNATYASNSDFKLVEEKLSHDEKYRLIAFQYDTGSLGYSRIYWAIVPYDYLNLNIKRYLLPDGYKGIRWEDDNILVVAEWDPYPGFVRKKTVKDGDVIKGVKLELSDNNQS